MSRRSGCSCQWRPRNNEHAPGAAYSPEPHPGLNNSSRASIRLWLAVRSSTRWARLLTARLSARRAEVAQRHEAVGMQQRKARQKLGVELVGLGVLGVVAAEVGGLLGRDHDDLRAPRHRVSGNRCPCVAGRLEHHCQASVGPDYVGECVELRPGRVERSALLQQLAALVGQARPVLNPARKVDAQHQLAHTHLLGSCLRSRRLRPSDRSRSPGHPTKQGSGSKARPRVPNRALAFPPRGPAPRRSKTRSRASARSGRTPSWGRRGRSRLTVESPHPRPTDL